MDTEQVGHLTLALPPAAIETHVFSALQKSSLISVGRLCDNYCQDIFNKKSLQVLDKNKNIILRGKRNISDGLWDILLTPARPQARAANDILQINNTKKKICPIPPCSII